jgi:hypothetical protein
MEGIESVKPTKVISRLSIIACPFLGGFIQAQVFLDEELTYIPSEETWEKKILVSSAGDEEPLRSRALLITQLIQPQIFVWGADPPIQDLLLKQRVVDPNSVRVDLRFNRTLDDLEAVLSEGDSVTPENENRKLYKIRRSVVEVDTLEQLVQTYAPFLNDLFDTVTPIELPEFLPSMPDSPSPFWINRFDEVGLKDTWLGRLNDMKYPSIRHNEFGEMEILDWWHSGFGIAIQADWPVLGEIIFIQGSFPNMYCLQECGWKWYYYHVGSATYGEGGWFWDYDEGQWVQLGE